MKTLGYEELRGYVRKCFFESRTPRYGLDIEQATDRTLVEYERVSERSDLEHLIVYLTVARILLDESCFDDDEIQEELLRHDREFTIQKWKDHLGEGEYELLIKELADVIRNWK